VNIVIDLAWRAACSASGVRPNGDCEKQGEMAIEYINRTYGTTYQIGDRIVYDGGKTSRTGIITNACGGYLLICLDGETVSHSYHPTWKISKCDKAE
jgi:hypothetical protein